MSIQYRIGDDEGVKDLRYMKARLVKPINCVPINGGNDLIKDFFYSTDEQYKIYFVFKSSLYLNF